VVVREHYIYIAFPAKTIHLLNTKSNPDPYPNPNRSTNSLFPHRMESLAGLFRAATRGNGVPLLTCLRTHCRRHCEPFSGQNALECRILHPYSPLFFPGDDTPASTEAPQCLDTRHQFRWARRRSCFTKRPLVAGDFASSRVVVELTHVSSVQACVAHTTGAGAVISTGKTERRSPTDGHVEKQCLCGRSQRSLFVTGGGLRLYEPCRAKKIQTAKTRCKKIRSPV